MIILASNLNLLLKELADKKPKRVLKNPGNGPNTSKTHQQSCGVPDHGLPMHRQIRRYGSKPGHHNKPFRRLSSIDIELNRMYYRGK